MSSRRAHGKFCTKLAEPRTQFLRSLMDVGVRVSRPSIVPWRSRPWSIGRAVRSRRCSIRSSAICAQPRARSTYSRVPPRRRHPRHRPAERNPTRLPAVSGADQGQSRAARAVSAREFRVRAHLPARRRSRCAAAALARPGRQYPCAWHDGGPSAKARRHRSRQTPTCQPGCRCSSRVERASRCWR